MSMLATAIVSALREPHMSPQEKLILLYLANAHNEVTGLCVVNLEELAANTCLSPYGLRGEPPLGPGEGDPERIGGMPLTDWLGFLGQEGHISTPFPDEPGYEYREGYDRYILTCVGLPEEAKA